MKKYFVIALAAMSMTLVSCKKSVEDQAKAYATELIEAQKAGDTEKAAKIEKEMDEWGKSLSEEDQMKAGLAALDVMSKAGMFNMDAEEDAAEEAIEEASAAIDQAVEDAEAAIDEAVENAAAAVEEAAAE